MAIQLPGLFDISCTDSGYQKYHTKVGSTVVINGEKHRGNRWTFYCGSKSGSKITGCNVGCSIIMTTSSRDGMI